MGKEDKAQNNVNFGQNNNALNKFFFRISNAQNIWHKIIMYEINSIFDTRA